MLIYLSFLTAYMIPTHDNDIYFSMNVEVGGMDSREGEPTKRENMWAI
jgi:hypothetical protein